MINFEYLVVLLGYALGSFVGGLLYNYVGGRATYQIFTGFALICSVAHVLIHKLFLTEEDEDDIDDKYVEYQVPQEKTESEKPVEDKEEEEDGEGGVMLRRLAQ